jgi:chemotaxis protein histidine kinase CheA
MEKLGGSIQVNSNLGKGTSFELKIPNQTLIVSKPSLTA